MFKHWAQPVTSTPWAVVAVVTHWVKRATGYRLGLHAHHRAWERACGLR
jgi:hypothetical protein